MQNTPSLENPAYIDMCRAQLRVLPIDMKICKFHCEVFWRPG